MHTPIAPNILDRLADKLFSVLRVLAILCIIGAGVAFLAGVPTAGLSMLKGALYCLIPVYAPIIATRIFSR